MKRFFSRVACVLMMFACILGIDITHVYAAEPSSATTEQTSATTEQTTDVVDENGDSFSGKSTETLDSTPQSFADSGSMKITYQVNEVPVVATTPTVTHVSLQTGVESHVRLASLFLIAAVFALCAVIYGMRHEKGGKYHA